VGVGIFVLEERNLNKWYVEWVGFWIEGCNLLELDIWVFVVWKNAPT
jgi:hypothetical protein